MNKKAKRKKVKKLKILVISGFLGAGKTTFIKEMVKNTKREYVIFENEFGDVNIDGEILRNNTEEMKENNQKNGNVELNVWELTSGCACCSTKADFISSLLVIDNTLNPDFLIVEPSGIAILSNILKNVTNTGYDRIKMFPPITIIDAGTYFKYKNKYDEIFIDQIKMAAYIQLSKVENMVDEELQLIYEDIKSFNPNADIFTNDYHNQNTDYWNALFSGELVKTENSDLIDVKNKMKNVTYKNSYADNPAIFVSFLEKLISGFYGDINRAKGVFKGNDYNMHFDVVDTNYNITILEDSSENKAVFIGNPIDKELLIKELDEMRNLK
ncbi:cobalamin synthesis protein P47K [Leptotrichia wadei]|uniref:Cobalamin synthesis protein P47K n=1 Tax=Leptotrichia wadei TaxID=157687 RepID=A0A510K9L0_9FUSO|nr:cobalamin synthesis protein P47K [Leptotrichia wadei]BBM50163.1 cobalamin synthesis protein P47K [Leptotrichia wadei]